MNNQSEWARKRDELVSVIEQLGFPGELGDQIARQLGSPRAIERLTAYILKARPRSVEMIVDEALSISEEIGAWRSVKDARHAQSVYSAWLSSEEREE